MNSTLPGAADRATMVGGRGVRLDGGSRVRHEPLFLAIDVDDAGGEARVRQASAVDAGWLAEGALGVRGLAGARVAAGGTDRVSASARTRTSARACSTSKALSRSIAAS